jgi:hypothetical protein
MAGVHHPVDYSERGKKRLGRVRRATLAFGLSTVHPPPRQRFPPPLGHHQFHLRHIAGLDREVAPELLPGVPGDDRIPAGGQDVGGQGPH